MSGNILSFSTTVRYSFAISLRQRSFKAPTTTVVMKIGKYCGPLGMRHFLGAEIFRYSLSPGESADYKALNPSHVSIRL